MAKSRFLRIFLRHVLLILAVTAVCIALGVIAVRRAPKVYCARSTLMLARALTGRSLYEAGPAVSPDMGVQLANLGSILTSTTVVQRTANALTELGITLDPCGIISNTTVQPIRGTEILAVEVRSTDQQEARDGVQVLVSEFIRFYRELTCGEASERRTFWRNILPDVKRQLDDAARKRGTGREGDAAEQAARLEAAEENCSNALSELDEATVAEQEGMSVNQIQVIDPARTREVPSSPLRRSVLLLALCINVLLIAGSLGFAAGRAVEAARSEEDGTRRPPRYAGAFRWRVVLAAIVTTAVVAAVAYVLPPRLPKIYAARATLMERHEFSSVKDREVRLANLASMVTSQTVVQRTARTLEQFRRSFDAHEILVNTTVQPVKKTDMLAVEVQSTDPREAEDAANVLLSEFIRFYGELRHDEASEREASARNVVARARDYLMRAADTGEGLEAAKEVYTAALSDLYEAKIAERQSRSGSAIKVIDPASAHEHQRAPAWNVALISSLSLNAIAVFMTLGFLAGRVVGIRKRRAAK